MAAVATQTRTYECARCGKKQTADRMVYSTFTHNRYCRNFATCDRRAKRRSH